MRQALTGLVEKPVDAQRIIDELTTRCLCDRSDISLIAQESGGQPARMAAGAARMAEFDALVAEVLPAYAAAEHARHSRPDRQRAIGAGHPFHLTGRDQLLLTLVWLRQYPTYPVLGYLFGVSVPTVSRLLRQVLPVLADAGRASLRTREDADAGGFGPVGMRRTLPPQTSWWTEPMIAAPDASAGSDRRRPLG